MTFMLQCIRRARQLAPLFGRNHCFEDCAMTAPELITYRRKFLLLSTGSLRRSYSTVEAAQNQIDEVNSLFVEARDLIEDARDEAETVYFNEAHSDAKEAVNDCMGKFKGIINSLSETEKGKLQRSMGLKMEQLKAELEELDHLHA